MATCTCVHVHDFRFFYYFFEKYFCLRCDSLTTRELRRRAGVHHTIQVRFIGAEWWHARRSSCIKAGWDGMLGDRVESSTAADSIILHPMPHHTDYSSFNLTFCTVDYVPMSNQFFLMNLLLLHFFVHHVLIHHHDDQFHPILNHK